MSDDELDKTNFSISKRYPSGTSSTFYQAGSRYVGTGYVGDSNQGIAVDISGDGNTFAVGGITDNSNTGATWVFVRSSGYPQFVQQGAKLVGTGSSHNQGYAVALSSNGNTLAVGGPGSNSLTGATWIFTRSAGTWSQQGTQLVGTGHVDNRDGGQGWAVALSESGDTLAVGGPVGVGTGASWIFTRTAGVWSQQGAKLVGTGGTGVEAQGTSVALSADGNTLAVGAAGDDTVVGAAWIFERSGGVWTQHAKLVGTGAVGLSQQGVSVSLSGNGNVLAVGGPLDNSNTGATWIFTRPSSSSTMWTQLGSKIVATGGTNTYGQGSSVELSRDASLLAVRGTTGSPVKPAFWTFTRAGSSYIQKSGPTSPTDYNSIDIGGIGFDTLGLSNSGKTLVLGSQRSVATVGSVWVFETRNV